MLLLATGRGFPVGELLASPTASPELTRLQGSGEAPTVCARCLGAPRLSPSRCPRRARSRHTLAQARERPQQCHRSCDPALTHTGSAATAPAPCALPRCPRSIPAGSPSFPSPRSFRADNGLRALPAAQAARAHSRLPAPPGLPETRPGPDPERPRQLRSARRRDGTAQPDTPAARPGPAHPARPWKRPPRRGGRAGTYCALPPRRPVPPGRGRSGRRGPRPGPRGPGRAAPLGSARAAAGPAPPHAAPGHWSAAARRGLRLVVVAVAHTRGGGGPAMRSGAAPCAVAPSRPCRGTGGCAPGPVPVPEAAGCAPRPTGSRLCPRPRREP